MEPFGIKIHLALPTLVKNCFATKLKIVVFPGRNLDDDFFVDGECSEIVMYFNDCATVNEYKSSRVVCVCTMYYAVV